MKKRAAITCRKNTSSAPLPFQKISKQKNTKIAKGRKGGQKKKQKHIYIYIKKKFFDKYDLEKNILIKKIDKEKKARGRMGG